MDDVSNRFICILPYFNENKTGNQTISANGKRILYFNVISNLFFEVHPSVGKVQYFGLKKAGWYRLILHVTGYDGMFTLTLKNSDNTGVFSEAIGYNKTPLEIVCNSTANAYYLLEITNNNNAEVTLYSDIRYSWLEIEYLG